MIAKSKSLFRVFCCLGVFFCLNALYAQDLQGLRESADSLLRMGQYRKSAYYFNKLASIHWEKKEYNQAIQAYENSLVCNKKLGNTHGIIGIYNNLGMIYSDMERHDQAVEYLTKTLEGRKKEKDSFSIYAALINLSVALNKVEHFERSIELLEEALVIAREENDVERMKNCYGVLAETWKKIGNIDQMVYCFNMYKTFHDVSQEERERETKLEVERALARTEKLELEKRNQELQLELDQQKLQTQQQKLETAQKELREIEQLFIISDSTKKNLLLNANKKDLIIYALEEQELHQQILLQKEQKIKNILLLCFFVVIIFGLYFLKNYYEKKRINKELSRALTLANQAVEAKSQFLSVMSHEIRTPLNAVIGYTQLLKLEDPAKHQIEYLNTLEFSSKHLLSLINDILDFSKIEAGKLELEQKSFNLYNLMKQLYQVFVFQAQEKNVELLMDIEVEEHIHVLGDQVRLNQIMTNLIGNALKFTKNGHVRFACIKLNEAANRLALQFEVEDTGIGIPENKLESIFEGFSQAGADTTRKFGGTGLGLTISKKLVELQNGHIWVKSTLGEGSTFYVQLEFEKQEMQLQIPHQPQTRRPANSLSGMRVLVVDDNKINRVITQKFLSRWQVETDAVENGLKAFETVQSQMYDLVLMDLHMPEVDGWVATRLIREMSGDYYQQLPIVAFSASTSADILDKVKVAGMNGFLSKPFDANKLFEILQLHYKNIEIDKILPHK